MNVYEHFACYTRVPIKVQDVIDLLLLQKVVDRIRLIPVPSMDEMYLKGICRKSWILSDDAPPLAVADVYWSSKMPHEWQRIVVCKELTHLTDGHPGTARTREQVSELIKDISTTGKAKRSLPGQIDIVRILHGLCLLFPRDAADILRTLHTTGKLNDAEIAKMVRLPTETIELLISPEWREVVETIS